MALYDVSNVHGWNAKFRFTTVSPSRATDSFKLENNRPSNFFNQGVFIDGSGSAFDHQGHIVPQNILREILQPAADGMWNSFKAQTSEKDLDVFAEKYCYDNSKAYPWLPNMYKYYDNLRIKDKNVPSFFDEDATNSNDSVGTFFSIAVWNPANICRAPEDNKRGGRPGNEIDTEVINYIRTASNKVPHSTAVFDAAYELSRDAQNAAKRSNFMVQINIRLNPMLSTPEGFYQFTWHDKSGELRVGPKGYTQAAFYRAAVAIAEPPFSPASFGVLSSMEGLLLSSLKPIVEEVVTAAVLEVKEELVDHVKKIVRGPVTEEVVSAVMERLQASKDYVTFE